MAQVRRQKQKTVGQLSEHSTGDSRVAVGNRNHMAEVIVGRLKFQLPALVRRIRQHVDTALNWAERWLCRSTVPPFFAHTTGQAFWMWAIRP